MAIGENERVLRASRLLGGIAPDVVAALARESTRVRLTRGEYVWRANTPSTHFNVIASGLVRIARTAPDGSETILALFGPRESIGDVAVVGRKPYPADAVALTDAVEIVKIDAGAVQRISEAHPSLVGAINASLVEHTHALHAKIRIMTAGKVEGRLATLLLHLASRFGDELEDGKTFIPLHLSRAECAQLVGATVETTIRTFSRWQKERVVETSEAGLLVHDLAALTRLTNET